ncbi:Long-chain base-1-phosphate phosphatase [Rhodotorula kratochvilovae]
MAPHAPPRAQLPLSKSVPPIHLAADLAKGDKDAAHLAEASVEPPLVAVGRRPEAYYAPLMPRWRFWVRQKLVKSLEREMSVLQRIQTRWRTPFRDEYFVKTSLLGTHTFFMVFLPLWYWFGYREVGRGLLYVLAAGGYLTSLLKDAFSVPRPFSPPVVRLSVGSHALEYGFPSTHSSNACSMALYAGEVLLTKFDLGLAGKAVAVAGLALFAWSVTFGRLYTGMHSMMDVGTGSTIGVLIWLAHYYLADALNAATLGSRWLGSLITIPALLVLVTVHPEPAEECPCFEDAVAFLSVVAGAVLGEAWSPAHFPRHSYGYAWRDAAEGGMWVAAVGAKLVTGISAILVWRIIAKQACHLVLPPLFRFFAPLIELPRRHYVRASEYEAYPPEEHLNAVPSILDLPSLVDDSAVSSSASASLTPPGLRQRPSTSSLAPPAHTSAGSASSPHRPSDGGGAGGDAHKDADVLTKVVVYLGIGWIATIALPWAFARAGWSVWEL